MSQQFIFENHTWLGQGTICLSSLEDTLAFYTKWRTCQQADHTIRATQEIEIVGISEAMHNRFVFSDFQQKKFKIFLQNQALGQLVGTGIYDENKMGWEFRCPDVGFEGFEWYEKDPKSETSYRMHAEYLADGDLRTIISGKIWRAEAQK